jgi:hypothetical protein
MRDSAQTVQFKGFILEELKVVREKAEFKKNDWNSRSEQ